MAVRRASAIDRVSAATGIFMTEKAAVGQIEYGCLPLSEDWAAEFRLPVTVRNGAQSATDQPVRADTIVQFADRRPASSMSVRFGLPSGSIPIRLTIRLAFRPLREPKARSWQATGRMS